MLRNKIFGPCFSFIKYDQFYFQLNHVLPIPYFANTRIVYILTGSLTITEKKMRYD